MATKTCLVTGGAGFIGSHLCDRLVEGGFKVIAADNLLTGSQKNIAHLLDKKTFEFVEADVANTSTYRDFFREKVDYIFHLASPASPNKASKLSYLSHPIKTMLVNSLGTYNLLELARKNNARFLFASTSEVYGDPKEHPQKESYWGNVNPNGIRACYDESKRFGEAMTMVYSREKGANIRIARIFNTYGPRMADDGRVVINFLKQAKRKQKLTVYGNGEQTRSFCYVSDLVEGLFKLMMTEGLSGEVINLGNQSEFTINELVEKVSKLFKTKLEIIKKRLPADDPTRRRPDISKARNKLGWEPDVNLDDGLMKTLASMK